MNPWNGWEITHGNGDTLVGPLQTSAGAATIQSVGPWLTVSVGDDAILRATIPGRYRWLDVGGSAVRLVLPPIPDVDDRRWLALPRIKRSRIVLARVGGKPLAPELTDDDSCMFRLPPSAEAQPFELFTEWQGAERP